MFALSGWTQIAVLLAVQPIKFYEQFLFTTQEILRSRVIFDIDNPSYY